MNYAEMNQWYAGDEHYADDEWYVVCLKQHDGDGLYDKNEYAHDEQCDDERYVAYQNAGPVAITIST